MGIEGDKIRSCGNETCEIEVELLMMLAGWNTTRIGTFEEKRGSVTRKSTQG